MFSQSCHVPEHLAHLSFDHWTESPQQYAIAKCRTCKVVVRIATRERSILEPMPTAYGPEAQVRSQHTSPAMGVTYNRTYKVFMGPCPTEGCCVPWSTQQTILTFTPIHGTYNAHIACHAKCMGATGPTCECSCGGKHHGGAHGA